MEVSLSSVVFHHIGQSQSECAAEGPELRNINMLCS
ncbi:unnamed protein product [Amoebophrya sp. A120]|nr:unnamed protein product [Amoebophrya sp. A120]|eukprot:GSA120T00019774001.1